MAASSSFSIYAKTLTGSTAEVRVASDEGVVAVKEKIHAALKLTIPIVRLVYDGKELEDSHTIADYNIAKEAIIIVVLGSSKPCHFFFALDESGSMSGQRWQQLLSSFADFVTSQHDEAAKKGTKLTDLVSVFFHQSGCRVASWRNPEGKAVKFDSIPLADVKPDSLVDDFNSGGNDFYNVLNFLTPYLRKTAADYIPVLMFMTDGGDCGVRERAYEHMRALKTELPELRLYVTVVFTTSHHDIEGAKQLCLAGGSELETYFIHIEPEPHSGAERELSPAMFSRRSSASSGRSLSQTKDARSAPAPLSSAPHVGARAKMAQQWGHVYKCNSSYVPE